MCMRISQIFHLLLDQFKIQFYSIQSQRLKLRRIKKKVNKIIIEKNIKLNRTIGITALHEQCNLSVYTGRRDNLR